MKEYVNGFYFAGGQVALIRKAKPEWQKGRLNGIGGKIEEGETPEQAMVREFREETAQGTVESDWRQVVTLSGSDFIVHFFTASGPPFEYEPEKCDGYGIEPVVWCDWDDLPVSAIHNLRWLIPLCLDKDLLLPLWITDKSTPEVNGMTMTATT